MTKPLHVFAITHKPEGFNSPVLIDSKSAVFPTWEDAEIERLREYPNKEYVVTECNYIHPYGDGTYAAMLLPDNHRKVCNPSAH